MKYMLKETERGGGGGGSFGGYILLNRKTMIQADILTWGRWLESERVKPLGESLWRVGFNELIGGMYVSTVFLGLDHSFSRAGKPIVFETMAFMPPKRLHKDLTIGIKGERRVLRHKGQRVCGNDIAQLRYATWGEAEVGHAKVLKALRKYRLKIMDAYRAGDKNELRRQRERAFADLW